MSKLTIKQKKFADEYIATGNATQSAINAGYAPKAAYQTGAENLKKPQIRFYIDQRMQELEDQAIAKQEEVLKYLTAVMRGEHKEETLVGAGLGEQVIDDIEVSAKDRIKAAELLGKRYGMWVDKKEVETNINATKKLDKIIEQLSDDDDEEISEDDL
ncbi:MAG TPA: terminase small subunit [Proteiniclasticum sp.]|uniref:terminase small subunit n=1 Tax=Proteiniclasticum sp. TaxID=2053595 RepID=UPI000E9D078E|nr:terminase small subunit [Proteiniclasticum sp.]HBW13798.1 terminase small subunit [Proteiniclasticum sp.]